MAFVQLWVIIALRREDSNGSKSTPLTDRWLSALLPVQRFYICTDNDKYGDEAAEMWLKAVGKRGRRAFPPAGKDLTAAWQAGHDLRQWVQDLTLLVVAVLCGLIVKLRRGGGAAARGTAPAQPVQAVPQSTHRDKRRGQGLRVVGIYPVIISNGNRGPAEFAPIPGDLIYNRK
ncbi:MAG: hypothetical protein HY326_07085 [Chloroflexi bacterium]|nr:hypothetical protein [Chloroflexota bacterium]